MTPYEFTEINRKHGFQTTFNSKLKAMSKEEYEEMVKGLVDLLRDLEWWQSCDYSEKTYRESVVKFKKKWFRQTKIDVQKQIESKLEQTKDELLKEFEYLKDVE